MVNTKEIEKSFWLAPGVARMIEPGGVSQALSSLYFAGNDGVNWINLQLATLATDNGLPPILCWLEDKPDMGPFKVSHAKQCVGPHGLTWNAGYLLASMLALGDYWATAVLLAMLKVSAGVLEPTE